MKPNATMWMLAMLAGGFAGPALADARGEVETAMRRMMDEGSFRAHMTSAGQQMTMDVQLPDRFRLKNEQGEFIILPQGTWMNAGGQWMQFPMNMSQLTQGFSTRALEEGINAVQQVDYVGEETVQGCSSRQYRYRTMGTVMGIKTDTDSQLWVCQDNGLPIKAVSSERGKSEQVTILYDWAARIDIQPPR
ncbi:MAG TPA: hypothetical protein VFG21_01110 [Xanthomonadaceae bacterium]|nr:hypothetical protein [Xanthomonadaceae bacterium]